MRRHTEQMMDPIRRGSTPSLLFKTPYEAEIIVGGFLTFSQRGAVVFEKKIPEEVAVLDGGLVCDLSQEETLQLTTVDVLKAQAWFILPYGKTAGSGVWRIPVLGTLKGGEI